MTTIQGIPTPGPGLRLHLNENTAGCSPRVLAAIRGMTPLDVSTYPDYEAAVRETARYLGVPPDWIVLTNGLDEGLLLTAVGYLVQRAPEALVARGATPTPSDGLPEQILVLPAFEPYTINAKALGARTVALAMNDQFAYPTDAVLAAIGPNTRLIHVNTPHNPSGQTVAEADVRRIIERAGHALVLIDEAYHDFAGSHLLHLVREYPNVMVGPHILQGARPRRHSHRRAGGATGAPRISPLCHAAPQPERSGGGGRAARRSTDTEFVPWAVAQATESKSLLYEALTRLGSQALEECRQLRARARRRSHARARGRHDCPRRARARQEQGARLRRVFPRHRRRGRTHARGRGRVGGTVRRALIDRKTAETHVRVALTLEGRGRFENATGMRFLDHMLELVARHGAFDLTVTRHRRPRCRPASHRRRHRHRARRGRRQSARRPQGHQPRRLLRDADGRDAGRRGHRPRRTSAHGGRHQGAGAPGRRSADASSCTTSSRASPRRPEPTST